MKDPKAAHDTDPEIPIPDSEIPKADTLVDLPTPPQRIARIATDDFAWFLRLLGYSFPNRRHPRAIERVDRPSLFQGDRDSCRYSINQETSQEIQPAANRVSVHPPNHPGYQSRIERTHSLVLARIQLVEPYSHIQDSEILDCDCSELEDPDHER